MAFVSAQCLVRKGIRSSRLVHHTTRRQSLFSSRFYSSTTATEAVFNSKDDSQTPRTRILEAALSHVNRVGWTEDALAAGAADTGLPPASQGMFERGAAELAEYWMDKGNCNLEEYLKETETFGKDLVVEAIFYRLEHTIPYIRSWPQAMALGLHPGNITTTVQRLAAIPDLICFYAGDKSYDDIWFTRRNAVGAIYAAAELYMLTDYSEGYEDTKAFIRRRVDDSLLIEKGLTGNSATVSAAATGVDSILTAAASMLGPLATQLVGTVSGSGSHNREPGSFDDVNNETEDSQQDEPIELTPVSLPDGLSLFGLVSMNSKDAVELVKAHNPGFEVIVWPAEESFESIKKENVVRLLSNSNDIIIDVTRY
mmetsp:Transcript_6257/g.7609  ORF Transcript_6257/g.7609 Transcript_6257/m.7609 type:complete len:369 (+) Transcript_6257:109-1215(+)